MPKVSVIIPVYNSQKYLKECLNSIVNQTLKDIEIILINDGSTDDSLSIMQEYSKNDERIKIYSQKNLGAALARNKGIEISSGEYLLIADADDIFSNLLLEKLYNEVKNNDLDIAICHSGRFCNETGETLSSDWFIKDELLPDKKVFNRNDIKNHIIGFCCGWSWDKLYKREFIIKNDLKFQNLKCTNDMYFVMMSLVLADKISVIDDVLINHRDNVKNSISKTRDKNPFCFIEAIYKLKDELQKKNLYFEIEQSFINWNVEFCFWHLDTLKEEKNKKQLIKKLKKEVFKNLNVCKYKKDYFYNLNTYNRVHSINFDISYKWYHNIFSFKNNSKKTHKIITFFGVKFKFKRKK